MPMELRRNKRKLSLPVAQPAKKPVEVKKRKKLTRSFTYRGIQFIVTPIEDTVRIYTMNPRTAPEYQVTVSAENERPAIHAVAKLILAEQDLAQFAVPDNVNDA